MGMDGHSRAEFAWGPALGGAAIVNVCTLVGVAVLAIPTVHRAAEAKRMTTLASGFAAGTLLAAAFFLMLPESLLQISGAFARIFALSCCLCVCRPARRRGTTAPES
jgi:zinc transporter ZupT